MGVRSRWWTGLRSREHGRRRRSGGELGTDFLHVACLVGAALLPCFAIFSGTYGLYFYVALATVMLAPWLLVLAMVLAGPLSALLLLILPVGALRAAMGRLPCGWCSRLARVGCLVSTGFAVVYGGLMMVIAVAPTFADGAVETIDFSLSWRAGVLAVGVLATWRAWRWLRRRIPG